MIITEQNYIEIFRKEIEKYPDLDFAVNRVRMAGGFNLENFLRDLITSIKQEEREKLIDIDDWIEKKCFGHDYDDHIGPIEQILVVSVDDLKDYIQSLTEEDVTNSK